MIRVIIFVIGLFLLWVLFLSGFSKQRKITVCVLAFVLIGLGLWYDGYGEKPRLGLIQSDQVISCGVTAKYSYRSNYNITYCLKNNSSVATTKRVELQFSVFDCGISPCQEIEAVSKQLALSIAPDSELTNTVNLAFDAIENTQKPLDWKVAVVSVKAVK